MTYFVKHRNGTELFKSERATNIKEALQEGVKSGAHLGGADLGGAHLRGAYLRGADLRGADLGGAYLGGADLRGADLRGADLRGAHLGGADLGDAYLGGADLGDAYLGGADLGGAHLRGAYLRGADLGTQWIIQGQTRSDGYQFFLQRLIADTEPMIKAGCRHFTIAQAQAHWETTRDGQKLLDETRIIVRAMVETMHLRGLK